MSQPEPDFVDTVMPSEITEIALLITSSMNGADRFSSGTAVIISPFLALTARHVLDDHWTRHEGVVMPLESRAAGAFSLELFQVVGTSLHRWAVTRFWTTDAADFAVLRLEPLCAGAAAYAFKHLHIDLLPPKVGERITAFGYAGTEIDEVAPRKFLLRQYAPTSRGEVVEVHISGRDPLIMPFPCFRTNARFDGSMSGGPVFNSLGHLCGLVCSTYPPYESGDEHASYVVLLWPAMGLPIDLNRVGHPQGVMYPMFDLVKDRFILAENAACVSVGPLPPEGIAPVQLHLPESYEVPEGTK